MAETSAAIRWGRRFMYIFNLGIPVFLAYTASQGYMSIKNYDDKSTPIVFQATYLIFFAALLFIFEVVQIFPIEIIDNAFKRNVGFLYGPFGRCFYTILIGIFSYGLSQPRQLAIITGTIVAAYGVFNMILNLAVNYKCTYS
jgi:hypothetical protein